MKKVKVRYEAPKGQRINRFARPVIELESKEDFEGWLSEYTKYYTPKGEIFVKRKWEKEKLDKGELCYSVTDYRDDGLSSSLFAFKARTVEAAKRKIFKISKFFPSNTIFRDFGGWINYGVSFILINTEYDEEKLKKELYKNLELGDSYKALSGKKGFDNLVLALRNKGYFVSVHYHTDKEDFEKYGFKYKPYWIAHVSGLTIRAAFATESNGLHDCLSGKVAADTEDNFNKWKDCEYNSKMPTNEKEIEKLIQDFEDLKKSKE